MRVRLLGFVLVGLLVPLLMAPRGCGRRGAAERETIAMPGLEQPVRVLWDELGVPHVFARSDMDLVRVQGFLHARDRFFQMDVTRRQASGDLAALLGPGERNGVLNGDIQLRTVGLRRAAVRSREVLTERELELLDAYTAGVNFFLETQPLPPEYAALELSSARPWDPVDTLTIGKGLAANLSLDIDTGATERLEAYVAAGEVGGFDGFKLFFDDVQRIAPMDPAATVPDATGERPFQASAAPAVDRAFLARAAGLARRYRARARGVPLLELALDRRDRHVGSNEWGVAAEHSVEGRPLMANDPHLSLDAPTIFYEMHLIVNGDPVTGDANVSGVTLPGVPPVILGQNERITWGATTNSLDVTDVFADKLVRGPPCSDCSAAFCIESEGVLHPLDFMLTGYLANDPDDGQVESFDSVPLAPLPLEATFIFTSPFRGFGPLIGLEDARIATGEICETTALLLQYTGLHATREASTFLTWNRSRNLEEFRAGLEDFDVGSQNWAYADADGNLAYFTSAEIPLRRDLESGVVAGAPPFLIRDGTSGQNNWIPDPARTQGQSVPYAVLPTDEMPHTINPERGFFVNANNDPAGTTLDNDPLNQRRVSNPDAIYYLAGGYAIGLRAGRITRLIRQQLDAGGRISADDMRRFQANTQQLDAELLTPFLLAAFENARRAGAPAPLAGRAADPRVEEAVGRLGSWDFSTPTGIPEGWDAADVDGVRSPDVSPEEAAASVAATLYNVWRSKLIKAVIDAPLDAGGLGDELPGSSDAVKALHHLLTRVPFTGVGASGLDFFPEPAGLPPADRRDATLLAALATALDALASPDFQEAFGGSTDLDDYRWGRLHRITFDHPIGGIFSIPPAADFADLAPDLPGIARDGGFSTVNVASFSARADGSNEFRFGSGAVRRYVGVGGAGRHPDGRVLGTNVVPGGGSGVLGSPFYASQLALWLTADAHPVPMSIGEVVRGAARVERFVAAD